MRFTVSHTTRSRRPGETPGADYHFINRVDFEAMIQAEKFVEWAEVHGQLYGTSWAELESSTQAGPTLILDVDIQGAEAIRKRLPECMSVFIMPPSIQELRRRLMRRETRWTDALEKRLNAAKAEMADHCRFDFIVVNDVLDDALSALTHIVLAIQHRTPRQMARVRRILGEEQ